MELHQLEYFCEVYRQRSFSKAADKLHIAQPSVTKSIKRLEDELGTELFNRSRKPLAVTESGELLYEGAEAILNQLKDLKSSVRKITKQIRKVYSIGIAPMSATKLKQILTTSDELSCRFMYNLIERSSFEVCERLVDHQFDLGWVIDHQLPPELEFIPIEEQEALLLLPQDSPLVKKSVLRFEDLKGEEFSMALGQHSSAIVQIIEDRCLQAGFTPKSHVQNHEYLPNRDLAVAWLKSGYGISFIPAPSARGLKDVIMRSMEPKVMYQAGLAYRRDTKMTAEFKRLLESIKRLYQAEV